MAPVRRAPASSTCSDDVVAARPPDEAIARLVSEEARRLRPRTEQLEAVRGLLPALTAEHLTATAPRSEEP